MPPKRAIVEKVQANETMDDLTERRNELDIIRKALFRTQKDRNMWRRLFDDCKQEPGIKNRAFEEGIWGTIGATKCSETGMPVARKGCSPQSVASEIPEASPVESNGRNASLPKIWKKHNPGPSDTMENPVVERAARTCR